MFNTLAYIGEQLNNQKILWGIGASILLYHYGLVDKPNDIDILVALEDVEKLDHILQGLGEKTKWEKTATYKTKHFYEYVINDIDVDVMSGLRINSGEKTYNYMFDSSSIVGSMNVNNVMIPLMSLEDWYVIYQLIPKREEKVLMIEGYLLENGLQNPKLLDRALTGNLPPKVRKRIQVMLGN